MPKNEIPQPTLLSPQNGIQDVPVNSDLMWEIVEGATAYEVQIADDVNFSRLILELEVDTNRFEDNDLPNDTNIYWRVRAIIDEERGQWSQIFDFKTIATSSQSLILISPENNAINQPIDIILEWQDTINTTNYRVQISRDNSFSNIVFDEFINQTSTRINGLSMGSTYYWRVQAIETEIWSETHKFITEFPPPSPKDFVRVSNGNFSLDGDIFRFAGTNAYYLPNYEKLDPQLVDNTFKTFEETGITVVRMWAFYDGYDCGYSQQDSNENVIQIAPGEFRETALQDLDSVIMKGKQNGIRFILTLLNYWDELGGICQYNSWDGAANPSTNMQYFLNSSNTQKWYKDYIEMLLNRVNTETGVAYKNEPAIFAWEIINEGRYTGRDPSILSDWYADIASYIKSIDANHLVSTGEEGFDEGTPSQYSVNEYNNTYILRAGEGTSYIMNTMISDIDYGSAHWYPTDWGFGSDVTENMIKAQQAWLNDHQNIAADVGKPFVLGEYGYSGWGNQSVLNIYNNLWNHAEEIKLDGSLLWQLTTNYIKCYESGGNICWPEGRQDSNLYNNYRNHIQTMTGSY